MSPGHSTTTVLDMCFPEPIEYTTASQAATALENLASTMPSAEHGQPDGVSGEACKCTLQVICYPGTVYLDLGIFSRRPVLLG